MSDLAVGADAGQIKIGSITRSERPIVAVGLERRHAITERNVRPTSA